MSTFKMEAACSSKLLAYSHRTTWCNKAEDDYLKNITGSRIGMNHSKLTDAVDITRTT
jgi:hypothetical protein